MLALSKMLSSAHISFDLSYFSFLILLFIVIDEIRFVYLFFSEYVVGA